MCLGAFAGTGHWEVPPQGWAILRQRQDLDLALHFLPFLHLRGQGSCPNRHCSAALKQLPAYPSGTQLRYSICRKLGNLGTLGQPSSFCRPALKQSPKPPVLLPHPTLVLVLLGYQALMQQCSVTPLIFTFEARQ